MATVTVDVELLQAVMTDCDDLLQSYVNWINTDDLLWIQYRHDDMHRDVIIAWANGQKVEFYAEGSGRWLLTEAPPFDPGTKYRVHDQFRQIKSAHAEGLVC